MTVMMRSGRAGLAGSLPQPGLQMAPHRTYHHDYDDDHRAPCDHHHNDYNGDDDYDHGAEDRARGENNHYFNDHDHDHYDDGGTLYGDRDDYDDYGGGACVCGGSGGAVGVEGHGGRGVGVFELG